MLKAPDERLIALLNKYIPQSTGTEPGGETLQRMYKNLQSPEMLIPVLGLQGVGKSTLINAILKENIMPNEADETTCIPVEVRYGEKPSARVFFAGGGDKEIGKDDLREYVDNNFNPGNKKNISYIVVYRDLEMLKTGLVLVDLPGVGSMTAANQETTLRYIKNLYSAIFLIRVNPPITRQEAGFIKAAWPSISSAWFVQNRWNSESDREEKEGLDANLYVLQDIAGKFGLPYDREIITVNAYKALTGVLREEPEHIAVSKITALTDKLSEISADWREKAESDYLKHTMSFVEIIKSTITDKIEKCEMTKEELKNKLEEERTSFDEATRRIKKSTDEISTLLGKQKNESALFIRRHVNTAIENIRADIFRIADGGVTDGDDLTQAFQELQTREFEILTNDYIDFVNQMIFELSSKMDELNRVIEQEMRVNLRAELFYKKQELKWEKGMDFLFGVGSVFGIWQAYAVGAPTAAALAGTGAIAGSFVPVVGTVIGLAAGLLVAFAVSTVGGKAKQLVSAERASEVKRQLTPVINKLSLKMTEQLTDSFNAIYQNTTSMLDELVEARLEEAERIKERNEQVLLDKFDAADLLRELNKEIECLEELEALINV